MLKLTPEFSWGLVGKSSWQELSAMTGGAHHGIVRELDPDVEYDVQYAEHEFCRWSRGSDGAVFMTLGTEQQPKLNQGYGTLYHLATAVRCSHALSATDPHLVLLDSLVKKLVIDVAKLHATGKSVGLLDATNIVYFHQQGGEVELVLPDVGFQWNNEVGGPRWVTVNRWKDFPPGTNFTDLWEQDGDVRAEEKLAKAYHRPYSRTQEIRSLARLLAWVLTGSVPSHLPSRSDPGGLAFWTQMDPHPGDKVRQVKIWRVLESFIGPANMRVRMSDAEISKNFATLVIRSGIKSHYVRENWSPTVVVGPTRRRWGAQILAPFAFLMALGALYLMWDYARKIIIPPVAQSSSLCEKCTTKSPIYPTLKKLEPLYAQFKETQQGVLGDQLFKKANKQVVEQQFAIIDEQITAIEEISKLESLSTEEQQCRKHLVDLTNGELRQCDEALRRASNAGVLVDLTTHIDKLERFCKRLNGDDQPIPQWLKNLSSLQ